MADERRRVTAESTPHAEEVRDRQADELRRLRADLTRAAARVDELTAVLVARKEELATPRPKTAA
ncbi:hypothetical protein [Nonomuraea africana]|uniref:Uncharacterized protein n=1 Tax=Nonomuraea africana TaxID=46171 RepID=A0ABR9KEA4_9ACTN|nr:hypothetical protein [Nonomuraea africana]MBE1560111.1 hypothetical protein [Nonomuraea africana]